MNPNISDISRDTAGLGYFIQARINQEAEQAAYQSMQNGTSDQFTQLLRQTTVSYVLAEKINTNRAEWTRSIALSYSSGKDPQTGQAIKTEDNLAKSKR
ncbi:MAG: hypothetical protein EBR67_03730 [Proteobacteria bacterium]|nr:hypothetical protein [Pseudomonadota bacterium]